MDTTNNIYYILVLLSFLYLDIKYTKIIIITILLIQFFSTIYLFQIPIQKSNPIIQYKGHQVTLQNGYYTLDNYYSNHHKDNLSSKFSYFNFFDKKIKKLFQKKYINFLCLGFGLGSIPLRTARYNFIKHIYCVDIDYSLFEIFKRLHPKYSNKIQLFCMDAEVYLRHSKRKYDLILDDIFDHKDKIFIDYQLVKTRLEPNGYFIINMFQTHFTAKIKKLLYSTFTKVTIDKVPKSGNLMIVCQK
jgi:hypothetical protein